MTSRSATDLFSRVLLLVATTALVGSCQTTATSVKTISYVEKQVNCSALGAVGLRLPFPKAYWQLCWRNDADSGLELTDVDYKPHSGSPLVPVLASARLAQIDVPYDDGSQDFSDLPGFGNITAPLRPQDCTGGSRVVDPQTGQALLCVQHEDPVIRKESYDYDFDTGNHLVVGACYNIFSIIPSRWYTYLPSWRLCDDGSVVGRLGAGGTLSPTARSAGNYGTVVGDGQAATSHYHNVFWRLIFDLGGTDVLERSVVPLPGRRERTTTRTLAVETGRSAHAEIVWEAQSRSLRNAKGHLIGYDLQMHESPSYKSPSKRFTDFAIAATQFRECERLASSNRRNSPGCGDSLDSFLDHEPLRRPVIWLQASIHHIPRDEDTPMMDEEWLDFALHPRNVN